MNDTVIGKNCRLEKVIMAEDAVIGDGCVLGDGEEAPNETGSFDLPGRTGRDRGYAVIPEGISDRERMS